ncbi:PREDICTED: transcription factor Sox-1-like isoform X2 [Priapulus caudatus]|nr:PREDICTED: transcription factor Sox-1-like isoform X2 [Priapulus caudatus]
MVFSNRRRKILAATYPGEGNNNISTRLGREWRNMPANEKKHYFDEAKRLDAEHKQKYPYYQYCPGEARKRKLQQKIVLVTSDQEEEKNTPGKTTKHRKKNMPVYTVIPPNGPNQLPTLLLVNQSGGQTVRDYVTQHLMKERGSPTEMSGCCHQSQNLHSCGPVGHGQYGHVPESYQFSPPMNPGPSQGQAPLDCPEPYRILNGAPNPGAHMYHHHHHHHLSYPSQQRPNDQCQVTPSGHDISGRGTSTSAHGQHHYCIHNMNSDQRSSAAVKTSKSQPPQIIYVPVDREYASSLGYADNGNVITEVDGAQPAIGSAFENEKNLGPGEYRVPYQGNNTDSVRYGYESEYQHAAYSPNQYYTGNQSNMVTTPTWSRQVVPAAQGRPDVHDLQVPQRYIYAGHPNYEYESNNSNDEMLGLYNTGSASISNEPIQQNLTDLSSATSHETLDSKSAISFPSETRSCVSSSDYDIEVQSGGRRSRGAALDSSYSDREQCFQAPQ